MQPATATMRLIPIRTSPLLGRRPLGTTSNGGRYNGGRVSSTMAASRSVTKQTLPLGLRPVLCRMRTPEIVADGARRLKRCFPTAPSPAGAIAGLGGKRTPSQVVTRRAFARSRTRVAGAAVPETTASSAATAAVRHEPLTDAVAGIGLIRFGRQGGVHFRGGGRNGQERLLAVAVC